jgi:hypothetical protein
MASNCFSEAVRHSVIADTPRKASDRTMIDTGTLASITAGVVCAAAGIAARPKQPDAENKTRTIVTASAAAAPVLAWIVFIGHPIAAAVAFLATTFVAGQFRDQQVKSFARRTSSSGTEESNSGVSVVRESDPAATASKS